MAWHCRVAAAAEFFQTQIAQGKRAFQWSQKDLRAGGVHSANIETGVLLCDCDFQSPLSLKCETFKLPSMICYL